MKNFYLLLFAVFGLFLISCNKNDDDPKPTTGALRATVTPAGSVSMMSVTAGGTVYQIGPDANNSFVITNLPAGTYTVTFQTNLNFKEPAKKTADVTVGNETNLGIIPVEKIVDTGNFSASLDGNTWTATAPFGTISNNNLIINGTVINLSGSTEMMVLTIPNFNGPGVYNGPLNANAMYSTAAITGSTQNWNTGLGQCSITVTQFDAQAKQVSGTFSFQAVGTSGSKTVTNGIFTNVRFQ